MRWSRILLLLPSADGSQTCLTEINALRATASLSSKNYTAISSPNPEVDLAAFFKKNSCDVLKSGAFEHITVGPAVRVNKQ